MKKKLITLVIICVLMLSLVGCANESYQEAIKESGKDYGGGYFTVIAEWGNIMTDHHYLIVYANDTKVKYLITTGTYLHSITPLYKADGTLQIYDGENQEFSYGVME